MPKAGRPAKQTTAGPTGAAANGRRIMLPLRRTQTGKLPLLQALAAVLTAITLACNADSAPAPAPRAIQYALCTAIPTLPPIPARRPNPLPRRRHCPAQPCHTAASNRKAYPYPQADAGRDTNAAPRANPQISSAKISERTLARRQTPVHLPVLCRTAMGFRRHQRRR